MESKVDITSLRPGGFPFQGAVYTKEGLEASFVVSYYARLRIIHNLLALLQGSSNPRVLSILNGGNEKSINESDIGLGKNWGLIALVDHTTFCTSLALDHLAINDVKKHMTFVLAETVFVHNHKQWRAYPSKKDGIIYWALVLVLQMVLGWYIRCFDMGAEESGERFAYVLTSDNFNADSWRTSSSSDIVPDSGVLVQYGELGWGEKIWEFTIGVGDNALAESSMA